MSPARSENEGTRLSGQQRLEKAEPHHVIDMSVTEKNVSRRGRSDPITKLLAQGNNAGTGVKN